MGLLCPDLNLDLKPSYVPQTINGFLSEVSMIADVTERLRMLDDFVSRLDHEFNKIQVFKRELPLCMLLLKDAISFLKQETARYKTKFVHQPVLEEFIPLNKEPAAGENTRMYKANEQDSGRDKKNWMSSVQLWSTDDFSPRSCTPRTCNQNQSQSQDLFSDSPKQDDKRNKYVGDDQDDPCENRTGQKGFVRVIHGHPTSPELRKVVDKEDVSVAGLSLVVPGIIKHPKEESISRASSSKLGGTRINTCFSPASNGRPAHQQPTARKQRRCWSAELHRRFVDALTQLGGAQVATPKQIRELMRVDGLTNDEVKSHLQKYRLHSRRVPSNSGTSSTNVNGNGMGGSWATRDQYSDSSKPSRSQSASPQGPLQFAGGEDSMEDEDDDKSESYTYTWKAGRDDV